MGGDTEGSGRSRSVNCGGGDEYDGTENSKNLIVSSRNAKKRKQCPKSTNRIDGGKIQLSCDKIAEFFYDLRYFPDSLLVEILIRLPIKSLFRNEVVCKHWLSLISHRSCARLYVLNRLTASYPFRIMYKYVYVSEFKEVLKRLHPDVFVVREFSVLFLSSLEEQQQSDQFKVLSVSNGLVMFCLLGPLVYHVCDPVTGECVVLPRGEMNLRMNLPMFFAEGLVSRVNEDNRVIDYKVVRVERTYSENNYLALEVFSSESGVWKLYRLNCPREILLLKRGCGPINFNGILHWFEENGMVAFDPYNDINGCWLIPFPYGMNIESERKHEGLYRLCDVSKGKLRFFEVAPEPSDIICFSMWILDDYEKREWQLEFQVTRCDLNSDDESLSKLLPTATFIPLSFNPFNSDVVYLRCVERSCIVTYNIEARRLDVSCEAHGIAEDLSWRVVIPVVPPMWPTPLPPSSRKIHRSSIKHHK